jgi:hypothetical protein
MRSVFLHCHPEGRRFSFIVILRAEGPKDLSNRQEILRFAQDDLAGRIPALARSRVIAAGGPTRPRERAAALPSSAYIAGRLSDNFWIIFCPVLALVSMQAVWKWSGLSDLAIFSILFGLVVTGHHMPGWNRAFGEPEVYARHKGRLWVSVFAIPALVILPTWFGLGAVALTIAATFDLWHVAM